MNVSATTPGDGIDVAPVEPTTAASKRDLWIVFWIFPTFFGLFGVIFVLLLRIIPPPRPDVGYDYMSEFFHSHATAIRIGFVLLCLVAGGSAIANGYVA